MHFSRAPERTGFRRATPGGDGNKCGNFAHWCFLQYEIRGLKRK